MALGSHYLIFRRKFGAGNRDRTGDVQLGNSLLKLVFSSFLGLAGRRLNSFHYPQATTTFLTFPNFLHGDAPSSSHTRRQLSDDTVQNSRSESPQSLTCPYTVLSFPSDSKAYNALTNVPRVKHLPNLSPTAYFIAWYEVEAEEILELASAHYSDAVPDRKTLRKFRAARLLDDRRWLLSATRVHSPRYTRTAIVWRSRDDGKTAVFCMRHIPHIPLIGKPSREGTVLAENFCSPFWKRPSECTDKIRRIEPRT